MINENSDLEMEWRSEEDPLASFRDAVCLMPAIKEFAIFWNLGETWIWHGHGFPEGAVPIELFEDLPCELQQFMYRSEVHLDDEDGISECQELPHCDDWLGGFEVPKKRSLFGWRPMKLDQLERHIDLFPNSLW